MQLDYRLREPLSKFEGLSTFYCNFINVNILYCIIIWDIWPIPTIRTTVRIIVQVEVHYYVNSFDIQSDNVEFCFINYTADIAGSAIYGGWNMYVAHMHPNVFKFDFKKQA